MMEDLFIEVYQNLKPSLEVTVEKVKDLTEWFSNLSPKTQENIIKFGLLSAAAGPVLSVFGKLSIGTGVLMQATGALTKSIGTAGGKGALGAISGLSRGGVVGLAIAGVAALSVGVYKLVKNSKEVEEANLDVAKSLNDQAIELDKSAETFDRLSSKAKISNEQLAELNDLNIRISQSSNPGEIDELQKQYNNLAKESGLSKDELKELFKANENIIDQTPDVKTNVSEQGNAFAKNTDAVNEYIASLYEATRIELKGEREKNLKNEEKTKREINKLTKEHTSYQERINSLIEAENMTQEERKARIQEISSIIDRGTLSTEEQTRLTNEKNDLIEIQKGKYSKVFDELKKSSEETRNQKKTEEEKLQKIQAFDEEYQNIILKQVGINAEGKKGLAQLDQSIAKNSEEILALEQKRQKNGELTTEEQKRYDKLVASNEKQLEAKNYLFEELDIYRNLNSLMEGRFASLSKEKQRKIENHALTTDIKVEEGNIVKQLQNKNNEHLKERENLIKNGKQQGLTKQQIKDQVAELDKKIGKNDDVLVKILKEADLWDEVEDKVNLGRDAIEKQGSQIDNNNKKTDRGIKKEEKRTKEASRDVDKHVNAKDKGSIKLINQLAEEMVEKYVKADDNGSIASLDKKAKSPIDKVINFVTKGFKWWAQGTPPSGHPGGHAVLGDGKGNNAGNELARLPNGKMFLSADRPTLYPNLPKGTHVLPARETKRILKSAPRYAQGTKDWQRLVEPSRLRNNEFMALLALNAKDSKTTVEIPAPSGGNSNKDYTKDLLDATLEQNNILMQILAKDNNVYLDSALVGSSVEPVVTEIQTMNKEVRDSFA